LIVGLLVLILRLSLLAGPCVVLGTPALRFLGRLGRLIQVGPQLQGLGLAVRMQADLVALNGLDLPAGDRVASMHPAGGLALRLQQGRRALLGQERADELDRAAFARRRFARPLALDERATRRREQRARHDFRKHVPGRRLERARLGRELRQRRGRTRGGHLRREQQQ
jgi:hypothetical protein